MQTKTWFDVGLEWLEFLNRIAQYTVSEDKGFATEVLIPTIKRIMLDASALSDDNLRPTPILDFRHESIQEIANQLSQSNRAAPAYLQSAHQILSEQVAPVYTLNELQLTSVTLAKRKGSCSQRFACLEALARAKSIGTRVRGLWVAGRFWAPRFRLTHSFIPRRILLAWPQFYIEDKWTGVESLFDDINVLARENPRIFANNGESLFDAVERTAIDFDGQTAGCANGQCDLSSFLVGDAGIFAMRDDLFAAFPLLQRSIRGRVFEIVFGGHKSIWITRRIGTRHVHICLNIQANFR